MNSELRKAYNLIMEKIDEFYFGSDNLQDHSQIYPYEEFLKDMKVKR